MNRAIVAVLAAASLVATPTQAQSDPPARARPKVVLVLSGGGAQAAPYR
jgi:hypothetical protein